MGRKSRTKGATFEREIARTLGTERTGTRGKADADNGDVIHEVYFIQCKRRAKLPVTLMTWWQETADAAERTGKRPMLCIREDRGETRVMMRLTDLESALVRRC